MSCSCHKHAIGAALPVVAALPQRVVELQTHRSFCCCCQAIVRTSESSPGDGLTLSHSSLAPLRDFFLHSISCTCSRSFSLWSFSQSFFLSSLTSVFFFSISLFYLKHASFSLFSHTHFGSFNIQQVYFIHFVCMISSWCPLLINYSPVTLQQLEAYYFPDPFVLQYVSHKVMCFYKQWWPIWLLLWHN